jgi:hypothetical protein
MTDLFSRAKQRAERQGYFVHVTDFGDIVLFTAERKYVRRIPRERFLNDQQAHEVQQAKEEQPAWKTRLIQRFKRA